MFYKFRPLKCKKITEHKNIAIDLRIGYTIKMDIRWQKRGKNHRAPLAAHQ